MHILLTLSHYSETGFRIWDRRSEDYPFLFDLRLRLLKTALCMATCFSYSADPVQVCGYSKTKE